MSGPACFTVPMPLAAAASLLCGCAFTLAPPASDAGLPRLRSAVFFSGVTRSSGVVEAASGARSQRLHVEGRGRRPPGARFELVQTVTLDEKAPTTRTRMMTAQGPHDYTAT